MSKEKVVKGKSYKGERFYPIKTEEEAQAEAEKAALYNKPGAIGLDAYFSLKGVRDEVLKAMMRAYEPAKGVKVATVEDWNEIFNGF
jgi:hypothetical protein